MVSKRTKTSSKSNKSYIIVITIFISLFLLLCMCNKNRIFEFFVGEKVTIDNQTFLKIGNGPAIDKTVMTIGDGLNNPWQTDNTLVPYRNHEGNVLYITGDQFRASNGFIPPSFEFFPFGINKDLYKPEDTEFDLLEDPRRKGYNVKEGRQLCLQACKDTNCLAVQTEVPQLCYSKRVKTKAPDGFSSDLPYIVSKGDCKGNATHGCTLFYRDIEQADDGYYKLYEKNKEFKLGQKYYENNRAPEPSPGQGLPSQENVKWCPSDVSRTSGIASRYETIKGATQQCSCIPKNGELPNLNCDDPNCCIYRDLLTTNFAKHNTPYYSLPLNLTKAKELENKSLSALCPAKKSNGECCGICPDPNDPNKNILVSCPQNRQFMDGTFKSTYTGLVMDNNIWWGLDVIRSKCSPKPNITSWLTDAVGWLGFDVKSNVAAAKEEEDCIKEFQDTYNQNKERAYDKLLQCCGFLDQACMSVTVQPFCSTGSGDVVNGCFGDPRILNVDRVLGDIGSCDDPSIISSKNRCVNDVEGKICNNFPYSCESGPLWKPI